jgi:hypothetical protein
VAVWKEITLRLCTNCAMKAHKWNGDMLRILEPNTKCICPSATSRLREGLYDTDRTGLCVPPARSDWRYVHSLLSAIESGHPTRSHLFLSIWVNKILGCYVVIITPASLSSGWETFILIEFCVVFCFRSRHMLGWVINTTFSHLLTTHCS